VAPKVAELGKKRQQTPETTKKNGENVMGREGQVAAIKHKREGRIP